MVEATCTAPVNIAVVKYWGKRSTSLILPTNSSLSVTLSQDDLRSLTTARVMEGGAGPDRLWLNGVEEIIGANGRMARCLAEMRSLRAGVEALDATLPVLSKDPIHIASENNFPTAAGLASSASGLSALIATLSSLYSLPAAGITATTLSRVARQGSGSACRSMFGGFVAWAMGTLEDGSDSVAIQVAPRSHWPEMQALVCVVSDKKKGTPSTDGMQRTVATSALLAHRIAHVVPTRMAAMSAAILARDFNTFALETMVDSNQFHAVCLDTQPPIFYLNDISRLIIILIEELNRASLVSTLPAYGRILAAYTFDAGPNAVIYTLAPDKSIVLSLVAHYFPTAASSSSTLPTGLPETFNAGIIPVLAGEVSRIIETEVGDGPRVLDTVKEGLLGENGEPKKVVA